MIIRIEIHSNLRNQIPFVASLVSVHSDSEHLNNCTKIFYGLMSSGVSERWGARERSKQCGVSERVSGASERAGG